MGEKGFQVQDAVGVEHLMRCRYEKLAIANANADEKVRASPRKHWAKKLKGGLRGLRLSRSRKITFKALSVIMVPSRIAKVYADLVNRISKMDDLYPNVIFSTQWGLPVLPHSSVKCSRRRGGVG